MAIQKYSFNGPILDLDNVEIPGAPTINKMMSDLLAQNLDKEVDVVKYFDWAVQIRRSGVLELDKSSVDELTKLIKGQQGYGVLVRRRLLACLETPLVEKPFPSPLRTPSIEPDGTVIPDVVIVPNHIGSPVPLQPGEPGYKSLTPILDRTENVDIPLEDAPRFQ